MNTNQFKKSLWDKNTFSVTWELVPGRGAREKAQEEVIKSAEQAAREGVVHALTLTDNPGGRPAISASYLGMELLQLGIEPLVHFTCKDKNRNHIESELYALDRAGVRNLLIMTGDYPASGFRGRPQPVFDLDPVHVLELVSGINQGMPGNDGKETIQQPADFWAGAVVSPFKKTESELMTQYYKLKKKIDAGARFIVTQLGYDARKFHEVLQFVKSYRPEMPVVGNIYLLPFGAGRMMNANQLPGCVVTDRLLADLDRERTSEDKGLQARLQRAAKMYAFMKGMGFDGVHLGGHNLKYEQVKYIIQTGEELSSDWTRWLPEFEYPQDQGFYYYHRDDQTGLNTSEPVNRSRLAPELPVSFNQRLMRFVHHLFFTPDRMLFTSMQRLYSKKNPKNYGIEHLLKVIGNDCKDCGDCALLDLAYTCPMSGCPKKQRNGPCGGSFNGWCEVYPGERKCIWVKVYAAFKAYKQELDDRVLPPPNWDLYQSSAWYNYYAGRDHSALNKK